MNQKQTLDCDEHGKDQLGYIVCEHVRDGATLISHHVAPRPDELGEMLCADCRVAMEIPEERARVVEESKLLCRECALAAVAGRMPA